MKAYEVRIITTLNEEGVKKLCTGIKEEWDENIRQTMYNKCEWFER